jgi:1,4-alpha-glucan branching enzyme
MKKPASPEQGNIRQTRASRVAKPRAASLSTVEGAKLAPVRKRQPAALLEDHFPDSEAREVSFEYFNPTACEVLVAGSFNDWQPHITPMSKQRGGRWSTELLLKPGCYEYRLVVDGHWQDDPMAARFVANPFGGLNCVVEVKSSGTPAARQP